MTMSVLYYFFSGFSIIAMLLGFFFLIRQSTRKAASQFMGVLLLILGYAILFNVLFWTNTLPTSFLRTLPLTIVSMGPLFYLYIRATLRLEDLTIRSLGHLVIPLSILLLLNVPFYVLSAHEKLEIMQSGTLNTKIYMPHLHSQLALLVTTIYTLLSTRYYRRSIDLDNNHRLWVRLVTLAFAGIVMSYWIYFGLSLAQIITIDQDHMITVTMCLLISLTAYLGYIEPSIAQGTPLSDALLQRKYAKSSLQKEESERISRQLISLLENEKIHLEDNITLSTIAERIGTNRNHLSQVINQYMSMSYYDLLNEYRIREALRLISDQDLSMKEVAFASGFNNRTSFYKAFKKNVGISPSEYKERY